MSAFSPFSPSDEVRLSKASTTIHSKTSLRNWTFGSGTVIWKIWPALLLHTAFGTLITWLSITNILGFSLAIPNVMTTVLGVIIGFILSYRVSSGYDRYWLGRSYWSDTVRNTRSLSRLIWFHVPLSLSPSLDVPDAYGRLMREKLMAMDLLEGFAIALKHYLREEYGMFYEDLYRLVRPLHKHEIRDEPFPLTRIGSDPMAISATNVTVSIAKQRSITSDSSQTAYTSTTSTSSNERAPLLPGSARDAQQDYFGREIRSDLIPFISLFSWFQRLLSPSARKTYNDKNNIKSKPSTSTKHLLGEEYDHLIDTDRNIPIEIVRCLSEYFAVLEARGVVPGTSMGAMIFLLQSLDDALSGLERILTTPLPWAYSVHIRHCIWIYLFFLPFQLIETFNWYTIPGVAMAGFYFLGFLAAGEEIEQPFGYDENDLDIESFIDVIQAEMKTLKSTPSANVVIPGGTNSGVANIGSIVERCKQSEERSKIKLQKSLKRKQSLHEVFSEV